MEAEAEVPKQSPARRRSVHFRDGDAVTDEEMGVLLRRAVEDVRRLRGELRQMQQEREAEQQRQTTAHNALTSEHQWLQLQHEERAAKLLELQQRLDAVQMKASEAQAKTAQWELQYEAMAAEGQRLRDENTEYSKRLLDVVRVASGAVSNVRVK